MTRSKWQSLGAACLSLSLASIAAAPVLAASPTEQTVRTITERDFGKQCKDLAGTDFSTVLDAPTQIVSTTPESASADIPEFCRVEGYVAPNVGFRIGLPSKWNGKFIEMGCGGQCGSFENEFFWGPCYRPLQRGYACIVSDTGHRGMGTDALWALDNLQAKVDWGFRTPHVVALAGKAITERYYTRGAAKSYFMGCSTGGRQALQEAQRFPWDFDGIVAGAPPINLATLYMTWAWEVDATHDASGKPLLGKEELKLATAAVLAQCGRDHGIEDGTIGAPARCAFDPAKLTCRAGETHGCLNGAQAEALKKLYTGPMTSQGVRLTRAGIFPGAEYSLAGALMIDGPVPRGILSEGLRDLFFQPEQDSKWSLADFDFDRDYKRLGVMESLYDSSNPDLRHFKAAGGKLIAYQGLNDHMARATLDYYETAERTMGGRQPTQSFFRLFVQPGVGHCGFDGETLDWADYLSALEAWVESGEAPERIVSSRVRLGDLKFDNPLDVPKLARFFFMLPDQSTVERTRPSYPYPTRAKYLGHGDPNDASSFGPTTR